ncbi:LptF/LptG family permease [Campylobacter pinnipediorum]|uniref:LptF/LptG family permease n=1 Tax=Campylobacter pinnipediorum TaxID=1965231 RepID=UPI000995C2DE|nr:LptF/LptG family permease [Campylobacter pinnipediorum]AQW83057.1 putative lipooligosaccharide transport system, permease component (LptF family) [Campylobacter pinnipediorum subsp. pinnipediorum]AQW84625.1 putative lipooligosaccharide transport system, permease component (LptF family) [Campylobacter pinnipediorum subsp. pinnipediorum]OPA78268.1 hypothetical protein BFG05_03410 [Campylobacter pinnipediorum subsp. pinnipediorum]
MSNINRYLLNNFISTFASLFSTLFLIMSIVFFIQIARITSYIEITFFELAKLYLFLLPRILLFVVPISFFVAIAMTLFRLSKENESIVIFTLGYSPAKISKFFVWLSSIFTIFLLVIAIFLIPKSAELNSNFIDYKKTVAKLNLKGGKFGQKFSDWMVYINDETRDKNGTIYKDIIMYNPQKDANRLIIAKTATISNINSMIQLILEDGKIYDIKDKIYHQSSFSSMKIRTNQDNKISKVGNFMHYWLQAKTDKKRNKDLNTYILISLFPLASVLFAISFGIVTYRYDKGSVYTGTFGVLFAYFAIIMLLSSYSQIIIPIVFFPFMMCGFAFYKYKIALKY